MKDTQFPLPQDEQKLVTNSSEEDPMNTEFDFAALDALIGEEGAAEIQPESAADSLECSEKPAAAKAAAPKRFSRKGASAKQKALIACGAVLLLLLVCGAGILIGAAMDPFNNRILANTTIGDIPVGGLTRLEAYRVVKEATETTFTQESMTVVLPDAAITLAPEQTKAEFRPWDAVRDAFRLGRKGTDAEKQAAINAAQAEGTDIDMLPYMTLDQDYIRGQLEGYAAQYNSTCTDATYQLTGTVPNLSEDGYQAEAPGQVLQLTLGTAQVELDVDAVLNQILAAYGSNTFTVTIDSIEPKAVPAAPDLEAIYQEFYTPPVDAGLDLETYERIPGTYGYAPDMEAAKQLIAEADFGETVSIPMVTIEPEIFGDAVYFRDELGYCETPHSNNENRNTNLRLACAALDGMILQPGEEFSFNGTVGERTKDKGYMPAPAYSGTRTVDATGGGVCQVSTTLYNAALLADMEIVFRVNHGYRSGYIGIGLDATVNWGGPDFQFRNNSHFPIMIQAEVSDGYVKVKLLGTDEKDYYIVMTSGYSEEDDYVTAWSYKNKYDKETGELISKEREAFSRYMR